MRPADPAVVRQVMARAILAAPAVAAEQGAIRLAPHQVDAASRVLGLLARLGGAVLADATGLGKTYVAIAVARLLAPALIVAPAALRGMWRESSGRAGVSVRFESYEALSRAARPVAERPALLILDEAHHARNPRTRRYATIADLAWGTRVLLLTATPIHNRARDLRALIALFLGSRAGSMTDEQLMPLIVRRESTDLGDAPETRLPRILATEWINVGRDPATLQAIRALPPAVPAADGGSAHALMLLGLIRAWTSSEAALRAALRRRLRRLISLEAALETGRLPDRRELEAWPVVDDAIQLGFSELLIGNDGSPIDIPAVRAAIAEHAAGVRAIIRALDDNDAPRDDERVRVLRSIRERHPAVPLVAFTQFADTADAMFRRCAPHGGVALVTGGGARVASGRVNGEEIIREFDAVETRAHRSPAMAMDLLIATDVLSEGLSLRRAGILVHLDLPWTVARLEQRVGRLRRLGSRHESIAVYAIGPPVGSRELSTVIRALQRKARVSVAVGGASQVATSLPLLGDRLDRAMVTVAGRDTPAEVERMRAILSQWTGDYVFSRRRSACAVTLGLGLVHRGGVHELVAIDAAGISASSRAVFRAISSIDSCACRTQLRDPPEAIATTLGRWLEEERGRDLARLATESPSPAHVAVLRLLQERLRQATRIERSSIAGSIERCRQQVTAARGIGAELALSRIATSGHPLDVPALQQLLLARAPDAGSAGSARLIALLCAGPRGVSAFLIDSTDSRIPARPQPALATTS